MKIPKLRDRVRSTFSNKNILFISLFAFVSRSLSFTWIFWDGIASHLLYKHQNKFPDQILRFFRMGVGISWFVGIISPFTAGLILIGDGVYSIIRYRSMNVTKNFIEDVPRLFRIGLGILLLPMALTIL